MMTAKAASAAHLGVGRIARDVDQPTLRVEAKAPTGVLETLLPRQGPLMATQSPVSRPSASVRRSAGSDIP
jgi:hypothetical protein